MTRIEKTYGSLSKTTLLAGRDMAIGREQNEFFCKKKQFFLHICIFCCTFVAEIKRKRLRHSTLMRLTPCISAHDAFLATRAGLECLCVSQGDRTTIVFFVLITLTLAMSIVVLACIVLQCRLLCISFGEGTIVDQWLWDEGLDFCAMRKDTQLRNPLVRFPSDI